MIITISLVNIHHLTVTIFSCDESFNIYPLSNFQIYITILLTIVTITSPELINLTTGGLYFLITFTHFPPHTLTLPNDYP